MSTEEIKPKDWAEVVHIFVGCRFDMSEIGEEDRPTSEALKAAIKFACASHVNDSPFLTDYWCQFGSVVMSWEKENEYRTLEIFADGSSNVVVQQVAE
jgi:hypothetical protein